MQWTTFYRYRERRTQFLLYLSDFYFQIIPKRAFANQAEIDEFRDLLCRHIQPQTYGFPVLLNAQ